MGDLQADLRELQLKLQNARGIHEAVGRDALLPFFSRRVSEVGIKSKSGDFLRSVSEEGARGNIFTADDSSVTVGVDYGAKPYYRWLIEGGKEQRIRAFRVKNLKFWWAKKSVMFIGPKVMRPARKPHPVYRHDGRLDQRVFAAVRRHLGL